MRFRDLVKPVVNKVQKVWNKLISVLTKRDGEKLLQQFLPRARALDAKKTLNEWWSPTSSRLSAMDIFNEIYPKISDIFDQWVDKTTNAATPADKIIAQDAFDHQCFEAFANYYNSHPLTTYKFMLHYQMPAAVSTNAGSDLYGACWINYEQSYDSQSQQPVVHKSQVYIHMFINFQRIFDDYHHDPEYYKVMVAAVFCHEYSHVLQYQDIIDSTFDGYEYVHLDELDLAAWEIHNYVEDPGIGNINYIGEKSEIHAYAVQAAIQLLHRFTKQEVLEMIKNFDVELIHSSHDFAMYAQHMRDHPNVFREFIQELIAQVNQA